MACLLPFQKFGRVFVLYFLKKRKAKGLTLTTAEKADLINLTRMYQLYGTGNPGEHAFIAQYYLNNLIQGCKDYRLLSNIITNNHYKLLAFTGLENTPAYQAFVNSLSDIGDLHTMSLDIWSEY